MDALHLEALVFQLRHLIFHQRNQRADHKCRSAAGDAGQLVAEGLARACRHDQQHILAFDSRLADDFLVCTKRGESERIAKQFRQGGCRTRGSIYRCYRCYGSVNWFFRTLTALAHDDANILLDAFQKRIQLRFTSLDPFEVRLPLSGHRRTLHFRVDDFDQMNTLVRRFETLSFPDDITALQQHLNDGGASRRRTKSGLFHRIRKFLLVERLSRGFHRCEQRCFGEAFRRPGLFLQ